MRATYGCRQRRQLVGRAGGRRAGGADVFVVDIEVSAGPCTYGSPGIECGADWVNPSGDDAAFIDLPSSVIPPKARAGSAAPRARPSTA